MPLSSEAQALITKLEAVHERAASGDREAVHFIKSLKTRALSGEAQSRRIYNTLAVIHWRKQKGGDYDRAEAYYNRLRAKEPVAMAKLQTLIQRVRSGDPEAKTLFSVLKSIHGKFKSSAFTDGPGAPKIGGYGLPEQHRAGIIIGADVPLYHGHGGHITMSHSHRSHGHHGGYPNVSGYHVPNPRFSGVGSIQPLTPAAVAALVDLMVRVRAMPLATPANSAATQAILASTFQGGSSVPAPSGGSTVPAPSGGTTAEPPICAAARSAIARRSPAAPALVAQCRALGFNIPFDPILQAALWSATPSPDSAAKALGKAAPAPIKATGTATAFNALKRTRTF